MRVPSSWQPCESRATESRAPDVFAIIKTSIVPAKRRGSRRCPVHSRWLATGRSTCCCARQTLCYMKHRCICQPRGKSKRTENAIRHGPSSEDLQRKHRMTRPSRKEADGPEQHIKQADVSSGEASPDLVDVSLPTCSPLHEALALAAASSE